VGEGEGDTVLTRRSGGRARRRGHDVLRWGQGGPLATNRRVMRFTAMASPDWCGLHHHPAARGGRPWWWWPATGARRSRPRSGVWPRCPSGRPCSSSTTARATARPPPSGTASPRRL